MAVSARNSGAMPMVIASWSKNIDGASSHGAGMAIKIVPKSIRPVPFGGLDANNNAKVPNKVGNMNR